MTGRVTGDRWGVTGDWWGVREDKVRSTNKALNCTQHTHYKQTAAPQTNHEHLQTKILGKQKEAFPELHLLTSLMASITVSCQN